MTGIEWESLHCQQSKCLLGGWCQLCRSLLPNLRFLARRGSIMLFLQPHLSYFFPFFPWFLHYRLLGGSAIAAHGVWKQVVLAVTQGFLDAALRVRPRLLPKLLLSHSRRQACSSLGLRAASFGWTRGCQGRLWVTWLVCSEARATPLHFFFFFFHQQKQVAVDRTPQGM